MARGNALLRITIGSTTFCARLEHERAPKTCAAVRKLLPINAHIVHARWSGEAMWIPCGAARLHLDYENNTSHPAPGELLLYPGGRSEMEFLVPYGPSVFSSKAGQLSGNHFATIVQSLALLPKLGQRVLWQGAHMVLIEETEASASASECEARLRDGHSLGGVLDH